MAPPVKPVNERKAPCAVSLTRKQRETLKKMGGSAWLQTILDAEAALMAKGRKALPQFVRLDPEPIGSAGRRGYIDDQDRQNRDATRRVHALLIAAPAERLRGKATMTLKRAAIAPWPAFDGEPGAAPAEKPTPKEQVRAVYPEACCQLSPATGKWAVYRQGPGAGPRGSLREVLGDGSTTNFAWISARSKLPTKKARKA